MVKGNTNIRRIINNYQTLTCYLCNSNFRSKYPLAIIHQLLGDAGSDGLSTSISPNINIMYDIVCKIEPVLKVSNIFFESILVCQNIKYTFRRTFPV